MKQFTAAATAAVLVALAALPAAASAESVVYTRGIYFNNSNYEPSDIWRANADGSNQQPVLVQNQTVVRDPALSPDGRTVAFVRDCASGCGGVSLVDINGANERRILPDPAAGQHWYRPTFHPSGQSLLVTKRVLGQHPTYVDQFSIWRVNADGTGLTQVLAWGDAWGPDQKDAVYSPDATRIAFTSRITPAGVRQGGETLWVANADGSSPAQLTTVPSETPYANSNRTFGGRPAWSPDGSQLAYWAETYDQPSGWWDTEIGVASLGGGGTLITSNTEYSEFAPAWSSQNRIAYSRGKTWGGSAREIRTMDPGGGGDTALITAPDFGFHTPSFGTTAPLSDAQLLAQYAPLVKYDVQETYRADSAATMTDNHLLDSRGRLVRQNLLKTSSGTILAAAWPGDKKPDLSLGYLGTYTGQLSSHLIDAPNTYAEDAQRLHANPAYANKTYARVVNYTDSSKVLQYWLFYYNNPKTYFTLGEHEGDWEMVQVHVDAGQTPVRATYSQHGGGERCDWVHVQRVGGRPVVYVAEGSHASYFSSGYHFNEGADDTSGGNGEVIVPGVVDVTVPPAWLNWPGHWGGSGSSPPGPKQQTGKWNDPLNRSTTVDGCTEGQVQNGATAASRHRRPRRDARPAPPAPPAPRVTARRAGDEVVIDYRFAALPDGGRRPKVLVTSIAGRGAPPLTQRALVRGRSGTIRQPVGAGRGELRVLVRAVGRNGRRGAIVEVPLR